MREGSHNARIGILSTNISTMLSVQRKGKEPRITLVTGTPVVPLTANKFNPTGGITAPISIAKAVKIPRCIGSTPKVSATGKNIGTVSTKMATPVKNIDSNSNNINKTARNFKLVSIQIELLET